MFAVDRVVPVYPVPLDGLVRSNAGPNGCTYDPMKERVKLTLSTTSSIAGTTRSRKQSLASGHLDMMCASRWTRDRFAWRVVDVEEGLVVEGNEGWPGLESKEKTI